MLYHLYYLYSSQFSTFFFHFYAMLSPCRAYRNRTEGKRKGISCASLAGRHYGKNAALPKKKEMI